MSNPQFAGSSLGNFRPTDIAGLTVWIDASQTGSFTLTPSTSNLATITDLAENVSYTIPQAPSWSSNAFTSANGLTYPAFNMTNGRLVRALTNSCTSFQHTAFIVGRRNVLTGDGWPAVAMATTTSGSSQFFRVLDNRDPSVIGNFRAVAFGGAAVSQTSNANTTQPFLYVNTFNGAATLNSYMFHSGQYFSFFPNGANPGFTAGSNGNAVMIGMDGSTAVQTNYWPGTLCEVILYRNTVLSPANRERVEGYLSWKWGLQDNLPTGHPYEFLPLISTAPPTGFNPEMISGLNLWLDASDAATLEGTPVIRWRNKSRVGGAVDGVDGTRTTVNGYPVLGFNGTNTRYLSDTQTVPTNSHTFVLVYRPNSTGAGNTSVIRYQRSSGGYIVFPYWQGGTTQRGYITSFDGVPLDAGNSTMVGNAVTNALNIIFVSITSGSQQVLLNGTLQSANTQALSAGTSPLLTIGYYQPTATEFFSGDIAEILIYSRVLTLDERINITGYEAWKWGLQSTLPVNAYAPWSTNDIRNYTFFPTLPYAIYSPSLQRAPNFNPLSLGSLQVWFDAADGPTITGTSQVTNWRSKGLLASVNATNFTGSFTSGNTLANGLNYINSPAGTEMRFTAALPSANDRTWFHVIRNTTQLTTTIPTSILQLLGTTVAGQDETAIIQTSAGVYRFDNTPNGNATPYIQATVANPLNSLNIYTLVRSTTTTLQTVRTNGTTNTLIVNGAATGFLTTSQAYAINFASRNSGMDIFEYLHYSRTLTLSEYQTVEGYLAWKWGIQGSLPAGHPFKNYPPPP